MTTAAGWHRQTAPSQIYIWKVEEVRLMEEFELPEIVWVETYQIGGPPDLHLTQYERKKQVEKLNRALRYGCPIAKEEILTIIKNQKNELIHSFVIYHVGFKQRPPGK